MRFRIQYNAPVVLTFALIALGALGLDLLTGGWSTLHLFRVYRAPLTDPLTYVRMVGHVLGHSGYAHYLGNMMLLLVVGPPLEEKYGSISGYLRAAALPDEAIDALRQKLLGGTEEKGGPTVG